VLKVPKIRSEKHRRFIAGLPCVYCRKSPCQAAHIRNGHEGGMGLKPCDSLCVPLCPDCHEIQGRSERKFWDRFGGGVDGAKKLARGLYKVTGDNIAGLELIARFR